ncbi:hypothetical protein HK096_009763 [Nowakowskiella sp. JEL0078]|nr:hypothetical protein HK096_009763 [Nowakowskiella sp. JEL0078]
MPKKPIAFIVGVGPGLGVALAKRFARSGLHVALFARNLDFLTAVQKDIVSASGDASSFVCDVTDAKSVEKAFGEVEAQFPDSPYELFIYSKTLSIWSVDVAVFKRSPFLDITPQEAEDSWRSLCFGAFLTSQKVLPKMVTQERGTLLFTGATASLRGAANFSTLAMSKFALRALTQSLAKEFHPKGVHVAHIIVDGMIESDKIKQFMGDAPDGTRLKPEKIADVYHDIYKQDKSVWTQDIGVAFRHKVQRNSNSIFTLRSFATATNSSSQSIVNNWKVGSKLHGFVVHDNKFVKEFDLNAIKLVHEATGAIHFHINNII